MKIPDFEKVHVQVLGAEESFGASGRAEDSLPRSAIQRVKVKVKVQLSTELHFARRRLKASAFTIKNLFGRFVCKDHILIQWQTLVS